MCVVELRMAVNYVHLQLLGPNNVLSNPFLYRRPPTMSTALEFYISSRLFILRGCEMVGNFCCEIVHGVARY
jgi:hypothetical protein